MFAYYFAPNNNIKTNQWAYLWLHLYACMGPNVEILHEDMLLSPHCWICVKLYLYTIKTYMEKKSYKINSSWHDLLNCAVNCAAVFCFVIFAPTQTHTAVGDPVSVLNDFKSWFDKQPISLSCALTSVPNVMTIHTLLGDTFKNTTRKRKKKGSQ